MMRHLALALSFMTAVFVPAVLWSQSTPPKPSFTHDGTVHVPAFDLPVSPLISAQARKLLEEMANGPRFKTPASPDIALVRRAVDQGQAERVARTSALYPADIVETELSGVPVRIITPKGQKVDPRRVLINLHGGAFRLCWDACSRIESQPIAALTGYKVVSVNYRMAPEAHHPAGLEDAAKVYGALARTFGARHIGVFGCSAGGALTAQLAAWLPRHGLPQAGALGIFGAGALPFGIGDSATVSANMDGTFPRSAPPGEVWAPVREYFSPSDLEDPIVGAALHPDIMKRFPPTLLITGSRAMDMTPAIYTNSQLIKAHVSSTLIVGEGLGHCYINNAELPEAKDAYQATAEFFIKHLR